MARKGKWWRSSREGALQRELEGMRFGFTEIGAALVKIRNCDSDDFNSSRINNLYGFEYLNGIDDLNGLDYLNEIDYVNGSDYLNKSDYLNGLYYLNAIDTLYGSGCLNG